MSANLTELLLTAKRNGVSTLTMNNPKRFNGWTFEMMDALKSAFLEMGNDDETKAVILTGTDPYYCAGVNLGGSMRLGHPRTLHSMIVEHNQGLFEAFIDFPKPILVAVNGPAIGASVTSATLCDGIIASHRATFSTPFAKLGVAKEGCSSVLFPRILGEKAATRMLEDEGWVPTGEEALEIGLAQWAVPHEELLEAAQTIAEGWVSSGAMRTFRGSAKIEELKKVNAKESLDVANSFLSAPFMESQYRFLWSRKKTVPALMFFVLRHTRPLWAKLL